MAKKLKKKMSRMARRLKETMETIELDGAIIFDPPLDPPLCICEPISLGCKCGRFEWEQLQKTKIPAKRNTAFDPTSGDIYVVDRPPNTILDYAEVPFRIWSKCDSKCIEVMLTDEDKAIKDFWWCWCDVSNITGESKDQFWFPSNGLLCLE
jgi:hypothetical protein